VLVSIKKLKTVAVSFLPSIIAGKLTVKANSKITATQLTTTATHNALNDFDNSEIERLTCYASIIDS